MKNKKLLYILLTMITFFSYNLTVNAAQELTCVYEVGYYDIKTILIQYESGEKIIFEHNDKEATLDSLGWQKKTDLKITIAEDLTDEDGNLTTCPRVMQFNAKASNTRSFPANSNSCGATAYGIKCNYIQDDGQYNQVKEPYISGSQNGTEDENKWLNEIVEPYTSSCIYEKTIKYNGTTITHKIQLNYGENDVYFTEDDPRKIINNKNYSGIFESEEISVNTNTSWKFEFAVDPKFTYSHLIDTYFGNCPAAIKVNSTTKRTQRGDQRNPIFIHTLSTKIEMEDGDGDLYFIESVKGINPLTKEKLTLDGIHTPVINFNSGIETCEQLLGEDVTKYINIVWNIIKFGIPIILIGLGTLDFVQAIFSGKEDGMKKAQSKFIKRIIISVVIFLVPTLLKLLLDIADGVWGDFGTDLCNLIF